MYERAHGSDERGGCEWNRVVVVRRVLSSSSLLLRFIAASAGQSRGRRRPKWRDDMYMYKLTEKLVREVGECVRNK